MKHFGVKIKQARKALGLNMHEVARRAKISYGMYCHVEAGENYPSLPVYKMLCEVLNLGVPPIL